MALWAQKLLSRLLCGLKIVLDEGGRIAQRALGHLLGGAGGKDGAASASAFGAHVDDVVGLADDVEVVLDDDDGVASADELAQHLHEYAYVLEVQSGGGLVEDVEGTSGVALAQLGGQFHALALAAAEGGGGLAELDVAQADVLDGLYLAEDVGHVLEEVDGLVDGHVEHVGYGLAFIAHLKGLAVVAASVTFLAGHLNVGQEVHLDGLVAVAAAGLAAAALDVEREAAGLVATDLGLGQSDEERADVGKDACVGSGVGARRAPDGRLVDADHLVDVFQSLDGVVGHGLAQRPVEVLGEDGEERFVDEGRLAAAADAGDHHQLAQGEGDVDVAQVVACAAL